MPRKSDDVPAVDEQPPATATPSGPVKTAEQWAEAKGFLPEFTSSRAPFARADEPAVRQHNPEHWRFAATKAGKAWPEGAEMTEAEFDAAVTEATTTHSYR